MSASRVPIVTVDERGIHSVSIAPGCRFMWWVEKEGDRERLWFKISAPGSKHYSIDDISVDPRADVISFLLN
jgi:hypothetical protein